MQQAGLAMRAPARLVRCTCGLQSRRPLRVPRLPEVGGGGGRGRWRGFASTSKGSAKREEDKLVSAARQLIEANLNDTNGSAIDVAKRRKELEEVRRNLSEVEQGQELLETLRALAAEEGDEELRELALSDLPETEAMLASLRSTLLGSLLPASPENSLSALIEIKSGVGGSESSLFVAELIKTFGKVATRKGWKSSLVEVVGLGGVGMGTGDAYREALLEVKGEGVFGLLKREAGVHRVQRVPATESQGRVHTSTVAVIVLPLEEDNKPLDDTNLFEQKDVKVEVMRSRGAGGQHVNKTESAIRLTHIPTGITVSMQDSRSQHENRTKAYRVLRSRLLALHLTNLEASRRSTRLSQVSSLSRSEKIRTYNVPQDRITDHRIGWSANGLEGFWEGGEGWDAMWRALERKEEEEGLEGILEGLK